MPRAPKRPRDTNAFAKLMVDILTGEVEMWTRPHRRPSTSSEHDA
jgi:hypothetical protein